MFVQNHCEKIVFNSNLQQAIHKLAKYNYFSYLSNAHQLIHWNLIDHNKKITEKGLKFVQGVIGVEKCLHISPRFPNDPDPDILRYDTFVFFSGNDHAEI